MLRYGRVELNWLIKFNLSDCWIKFDKLCRATQLLHDIDSNVALNLCQTQCVHYDNAYFTIIPVALSYMHAFNVWISAIWHN